MFAAITAHTTLPHNSQQDVVMAQQAGRDHCLGSINQYKVSNVRRHRRVHHVASQLSAGRRHGPAGGGETTAWVASINTKSAMFAAIHVIMT